MKGITTLRHLCKSGIFLSLVLLSGTARAEPPTARQRIDEILDLIGNKYISVVPADSLFNSLQEGVFKSLDPYSAYLDAQSYADLKLNVAGSFGGIGAVLREDSVQSMIRIVAPFKGAPADKAGIRPGDLLTAVNGKSMAGATVDDARAELIGTVGTPVTVTIRRVGQANDFTLSLKRGTIPTPTVRGYRHPSAGKGQYLVDPAGTVGYIRIQSFAKTTPDEFVRAVTELQATGATTLVLDLRASYGGLMNAAIETADQLLDEGTIVTVRKTNEEKVYQAKPGICTKLPIAMLIDEGTASSSEIFAAAIADNHRVTVIGPSHSYGKGHGQELFPLKKDKGGVKLTTFSFHRPSGLPMERHFGNADSALGGIWPDSGMTVPVSETEGQKWLDATFEMDGRMQFTDEYVATLPPITAHDEVLERAMEYLKNTAK